MNIKDIEINLDKLLKILSSLQNEDGSFDTYAYTNYYTPKNTWLKHPENSSFDLASILLNIINLKCDQVEKIKNLGILYLLNKSCDNKFWRFSYVSKERVVPYDIDTTALASLVIENYGYKVNNKSFFIKRIENNNFSLWIGLRELLLNTDIKGWVKKSIEYYYVHDNQFFKNKSIEWRDNEFSVECNVYIYLHKKNILSEKLRDKIFREINSLSLRKIYYYNDFLCYYIFARMAYHSNLNINSIKKDLLNMCRVLSENLHDNTNSLNTLLLGIAALYLNIIDNTFVKLNNQIFNEIKNYDYLKIYAYYSSSIINDINYEIREPKNYFGSPAIRCSLYIEFLNMYRKRFYGKYYGEV